MEMEGFLRDLTNEALQLATRIATATDFRYDCSVKPASNQISASLLWGRPGCKIEGCNFQRFPIPTPPSTATATVQPGHCPRDLANTDGK